MPNFNINFTVDGESQTITRTSPRKVRAGSRNYFYAVFQFLDSAFTELEGLTAVFSGVPYERNRGGAYKIPLEEHDGNTYTVQVPWEVLTRRGTVYVGVFAGDMLVTNEAEFEVTKAAPTDGGNPVPSQTWLAKLLAMIAGKQDKLTAGENITIEDNVISASGGGGGGGDSYWRLFEGVLQPVAAVEAVSFEDLPISAVDSVLFSDGTTATKLQLLLTAPTASTTPLKGVGTLAYAGRTYYICTGGSEGNWVWSSLATYAQVAPKYTLPANGIPKTDLAEAVRASLDLADTALQSGDLAAYRTASAQDVIDQQLAAEIVTRYIFPTGGIPYSDMSSGVKASLDKADTALQTHQDISGKQNRYIGTADAGKFLVVGSDGNITAVALSTLAGGNY